MDLLNAIAEGGVDAKLLMDWVMSTPKERRPRIGSKLVYVSLYRPLTGGGSSVFSEPGIAVYDVDGGRRGLVLADEPLRPEVMEEHDLVPFGKAAAWALMTVTGLPIELAKVMASDGVVRAALIHEGTRGEARLTWFEENVGPTGHQEGEYPELIDTALKLGYRRLSPGIVDNIIATTM
jgi:hypothetical protein